MEYLTVGLLWFSAISVGLLAGVYFAFSGFVMRSIDAMEAPAGMKDMQSINRVIVLSAFLPTFFASTIACVAMVVIAVLDFSAPGAVSMLIGSALYVAGLFLVTVVRNVPLNNQLDATLADGLLGPVMWEKYLIVWTRWNHVRTVCCTISLAFLIHSISTLA